MKSNFTCLICAEPIAKSDVRFVDEDSFPFLKAPPAGLALGIYCPTCFARKIEPELDMYNAKMDAAKNVNVFFVTQSKESYFVRRHEKPIQVDQVLDRDEAVLRLAFLAVENGYNAIVDVDLKAEKVFDAGYKSSIWTGRAIPAQIDEANLQRRERTTTRLD